MITVRRKLVFNLDRYEQHEIEVTIDEIPDDTSPDEVANWLDDMMLPDIERAALATSHAIEDNATSVYTWKSLASREGADAHH